MRLRLIIFILAVFAFLSASTGGWLYYYSYREAAFQRNESDADSKLNLLTRQFAAHLSEHIKPVKALSGIKELKKALEETNLETIYRANQILDHFASAMDLDVCYLMDVTGVTLCSSNRNAADSFVGKDFSFRPYYKHAVQGEPSTYLALGTTSSKRGVYFSHPVYDSRHKNIIGVTVIKSSIEFLEASLFSESKEILLFTDPQGVIFMSNVPDYRFQLLWPLSEKTMNAIVDSRQFGNGPWEWSGFDRSAQGVVTDKRGNEYLYSGLSVSNYPGWQIVSLRNKKEIQRQVTGPFISVIGPIVIFVSVMAGLLVFLLYQMAARELLRRKRAEEQLKVSEQRYRRIYHKTPVMLHSIDRDGRIIHVSDHWVEVMGFDRKDVIGRQLTDFFTEASKKYALNVIFPRFFSTGFCKDIPYTYVKKNGEKMDTLLSCYGVRNERGEILRSLAVSVDVTEKNLVQRDLEKAKEKLYSYSHDLEGQVRRRTAQLEAAQASLKKLSKNIIASQEREKELVARELHDHLGQVLTALRIDSVWAEKKLNGIDPKAGQRAAKMSDLIESTIQDVRDMAYRLRPRVLDDLGLTDALESLVSDFEKRSNVSCIFRHDDIPEIDKTLATTLYRIGQEALTNALRHSRASTILVELKTDPQGIVLTIRDDGCGFETDANGTQKGFGLESMAERANLVGGKLTINSAPDEGTLVSCKISLGRYI
ncbi:MAG TPA: transcriptional regulator [Desulfobacteraceae bacterium]|nr:transcriptional regulator [Desulfobacteraceae bacterium]